MSCSSCSGSDTNDLPDGSFDVNEAWAAHEAVMEPPAGMDAGMGYLDDGSFDPSEAWTGYQQPAAPIAPALDEPAYLSDGSFSMDQAYTSAEDYRARDVSTEAEMFGLSMFGTSSNDFLQAKLKARGWSGACCGACASWVKCEGGCGGDCDGGCAGGEPRIGAVPAALGGTMARSSAGKCPECPPLYWLEANPSAPPPVANGCGAENGMPIPNRLAGDFTEACNKHDECYDTCGASKAACDEQFGEDMAEACKDQWDPRRGGGGSLAQLGLCMRWAAIYEAVVSSLQDSYCSAQLAACHCCTYVVVVYGEPWRPSPRKHCVKAKDGR